MSKYVAPPPIECEVCGGMVGHRMRGLDGSGWVQLDCHHCYERALAKKAGEDQAQKALDFWKEIPLTYHHARIGNLHGFDDLREATQREERGLVFITGAAGLGKTYALYAIHIARYLSGAESKYVDLREFLFNVKLHSGDDYFTEAKAVRGIADFSGVLLLDDLGAESISKVTMEAVDIILSAREKWRTGMTVITSNLSLKEIGNKFDDRIASRLSGGIVLELEGEDRRLGGANG